MSDALKQVLMERTKAEKSLSIADFMSVCLGHPTYGYYNTRDPFGQHDELGGDFITAPEISQMFGEIIGVWIADSWFKMGCPDPVILLEVGPGRGTLMHDILRATKRIEAFHAAIKIHLLEMSPVLQKMQEQQLHDFNSALNVTWHTDLNTLPPHAPVIIIGNEFLDALPVKQFSFGDTSWAENRVVLSKDGTFRLCKFEANTQDIKAFPKMLFPPLKGDQLEVSLELDKFIADISRIFEKQGGLGVFIDYGYTIPTYGTTLQAIMNHQFVSFLEHVGEADITAHVNFAHLSSLFMENNLTVQGVVSQGDFLNRLGIEARADVLRQNATGHQMQDIQSALIRLCGTDTKANQMGNLFKVIAFSSNPDITLEGFS